MRIVRAVPVIFVALALAGTFAADRVLGSEEIGKKESLACTACHDKPGSKLLTDKGKYYEVMRSTAGFDELKATFGKCTACHDTKPGSLELTERGEQFRFMVEGMEGLAEWMKEHHPTPPAEGDAKPPAETER